MTSAADFGISIGTLAHGRTNSVIDVPGVGLGHVTIVRDEPNPPQGRGVARTGVTVLDPGGDLWAEPIAAGGSVLNGAGELTGFHSAQEWGLVESPVYLTSTMQLGRVYDAACRIALSEQAQVAEEVIIPVVGECDDSWLSFAGAMHVDFEDVNGARAAARRSVGSGVRPDSGAVGAGTGMLCLGWKGGIGTSSRVVGGHTVGVLLLANFGQWDRLTVGGVPVGRLIGRSGMPVPSASTTGLGALRSTGPEARTGLGPPSGAGALRGAGPGATPSPPAPAGSCVGIVVTDAPIDSTGCRRLAARIGLGLARAGSTAHHGSGEIFLGLSVGHRAPRGSRATEPLVHGTGLDPLFEACVDAAEEAVLDALLNAQDVTGQRGRTALALPHDELRQVLAGRR